MRKYNFSVKTALAVFAVALSACSSDNDIVENNSNNQEQPVTNQTMTFRASMDGVTTRTDFNSNSTIWATKDKISILNTADVNEQHPEEGVFNIDAPANGSTYGKEETFSGTKIKANGNNNDQFYAFYPADADNFTNTNGTVKMTATIPTVQKAIAGTYDQSLHFMSAYSTNSTFAFKNVCALLKITITNNTQISRIKVVANPKLSSMQAQQFTYTSIVGEFDATIGTNGIASVTPNEDEKTFVELRADGEGGSITKIIPNGTYYMVVLPAQLDNGFTLLIERANGTIYQRVNTKLTSFERNNIYDLGTYNVSGAITNFTPLSYEYAVDLDLPSGTIWCTKNLAADGNFKDNESDYGDYFSWGKTSFTGASTYGSMPTLNDNTLQSSDDPAYVGKKGSGTSYNNNAHRYCMPIYAQIYELFNKIHSVSSNTGSGNKGARFTSAAGNTMWLPYGGHYYSSVISIVNLGSASNVGSQGDYWSRTYYGRRTASDGAYCLDILGNGTPSVNQHSGFDFAQPWIDNVIAGRTIRAVAVNEKIAPLK